MACASKPDLMMLTTDYALVEVRVHSPGGRGLAIAPPERYARALRLSAMPALSRLVGRAVLA
jgi:hypothetical protein